MQKSDKITWGFFENLIPYIKVGNGPKTVVYIRGGEDLLISLIKNPVSQGHSKLKLIPSCVTLYILGYDPHLAHDMTLEKISEDFARIIKINIGESILIGSSFGGFVSMNIAAKYPELIRKLILTCSASKFSSNFETILTKWINFGEKNKILALLVNMNDFFNGTLIRWSMKLLTIITWPNLKKKVNNPSNVITILKDTLMKNGNLESVLPKIQAVTYIIGGTKDIVFSEQIFQETAKLIPNSHLFLFPNYGHQMAVEHSKNYRKIMKEILLLD